MFGLAGCLAIIWLAAAGGGSPAGAKDAVSAKQFPTGYFYRYHKVSIPEKEKVLARLDATLQRLNREGLGLIAKGAVIGKLGTDKPVYEKLDILDESGLIITARRVPNLYYGYPGPGPLNPNLYIVIKRRGSISRKASSVTAWWWRGISWPTPASSSRPLWRTWKPSTRGHQGGRGQEVKRKCCGGHRPR